MPLRRNNTLWFNLPGVVAAYQPVKAPGPLVARYNVRQGGTNAYKAIDGVAPTWSGTLGWTFNGSSQYLKTGFVFPGKNFTGLIRFNMTGGGVDRALAGEREGGKMWNIMWENPSWYIIGVDYVDTPSFTSGIIGTSGNSVIKNGLILSGSVSFDPSTYDIYLGGANVGGSMSFPFGGSIFAAVFYNRTLSASEVWSVSQQISYCDTNPDWSAWGVRRRWFYLAAGGTIQIEGTAAGTATQAGALRGAGALAGTSAGTTTQAGALRGVGALVGTSAGSTTQAGVLLGVGALAGTSAGVATQAGALLGAGVLQGAVTASATQTGALLGRGTLSGTSAGVATNTGNLNGSGLDDIRGTVAGSCSLVGELFGAGTLIGTAAGTSYAELEYIEEGGESLNFGWSEYQAQNFVSRRNDDDEVIILAAYALLELLR